MPYLCPRCNVVSFHAGGSPVCCHCGEKARPMTAAEERAVMREALSVVNHDVAQRESDADRAAADAIFDR